MPTKHRSCSHSASASALDASGVEGARGRARARRREVSVLGDDSRERRRRRSRAGEPMPVRWTAAAEARLANIPEFVRPMARTGIEKFAREKGTLRGRREDPRRRPRLLRHVTTDATSPPALSPDRRLRPALRRLLEPHLPLQPRLRALLSRRRRRASGRHGELRRSERARHRGVLQGHRRNRRVRA